MNINELKEYIFELNVENYLLRKKIAILEKIIKSFQNIEKARLKKRLQEEKEPVTSEQGVEEEKN